MKIGVDLDGVCYDFTAAYCRYVGKDPATVNKWRFYEDWAWTEDKFLDHAAAAIAGGELFRRGDLIPGAKEALDALTSMGYTIHLVTDRASLDSTQAARIKNSTYQWLHDNGLPWDSVHFEGNKAKVVKELGLDFFLDDNIENYDAVEPHCKAYLFDQPWNYQLQDERVRVHGWEQFVRVIEQASATKNIIANPSLEEVRVTSETETRIVSETGGAKGQKLARLGSLDPQALLEVAKVAGFGEQKYDRLNYMKGYDWSLSFDAGMRHRLAFWNGEDVDPESGLPHLAHAAWHDLTQLAFFLKGIGNDDRYPTWVKKLAELVEEEDVA